MKITGTKKLLIIFFVLISVLAVGLGFTISRSGAPSYAESDASLYGDVLVEGTSLNESEEEPQEELDAEEGEEESAEEFVEEEYDERFDEDVIRQVSDLMGVDFEFVNLYFHIKQVDAREVLALLIADEERVAALPETTETFGHSSTGEDYVNPDETSDYSAAEENSEPTTPAYIKQNNEDFYNELFTFQSEYRNHEIAIPEGAENNDWFISPDDCGVYATFTYYGYNYANGLNAFHISIPNVNSGLGRTIQYPAAQLATANGTAAQVIYWQYYVQLAPGQTFKMTRAQQSSWETYRTHMSVDTNNPHWAYTMVTGWAKQGSSTLIIDGDAPTGTALWVYFGWDTGAQASQTNYGRWRWTWALSTTSATGTDASNGYAYKCSSVLCYKFVIRRTSPVSPKLVDDTATNGGKVDTSTNTKTAYFEGSPVKITMSGDFGAGIITYSYDDTVTLVSRSQHGVTNPQTSSAGATNPNGINIVFQSSAAGLHIIKIRLVQPSAANIAWPTNSATNLNSGTIISTKMSWSDTTATEIEFRLQINLQTTEQPSMVSEMGVNGARSKKTVNYNGSAQTVSFQNADKNFVGWSSNGLTEASWDNNGNLTLKQTERGVYTINLYLKNPAGCTWKDGTTTTFQFTFEIKEMLIEKPKQVGNESSFEKKSTYDGAEQILTLSPIDSKQVIIIAPGVQVVNNDSAKKADFKMTDANSVTIILMPAEGYIWSDGTNDPINFVFTIDPKVVNTPKLVQDETGAGVSYGSNGLSKTVTFNPTVGWYGTLVIEDIPYGSMKIISALQTKSWEDDVLTLFASNANTYPVNLELSSTNFKWASGAMAPRFELTIERYVLQHPIIAEDTNVKSIEGATKTVYYNYEVDSTSGPSTSNAEKFFELFVGGFKKNTGGFMGDDQISIRYSETGLIEEWACTEHANCTTDHTKWDKQPYLTLWATNKAHPTDMSINGAGPAGNYIIYITPTANYMWEDKTNDMYTFKFVVTPIMRDQLPMYLPQSSGNAWTEVGDRIGTATYNGQQQFFRIGSPDNPALFYDQQQLETPVVEIKNVNTDVPKGGFDYYIDKTSFEPIVDGGTTFQPVILVCYAVEAGTYTVKLQLKNHNYAWRDGSGIDIFYTFTIEQKSIENPAILKDECSGHEVKVYEAFNYITARYDGNETVLAVSVPNVLGDDGVSKDIIGIMFDTELDIDPETGELAIRQIKESAGSGSSLTETGRLLFGAKIVGTHWVYLSVTDPNYRWASGSTYFTFSITINYALVDDVVFNFGDPTNGMQVIGGNNSWKSVTYDPTPGATQNITITRALKDTPEGPVDEFAATKFTDQFRLELSYYSPLYGLTNDHIHYNDGNIILEFSDANTYYISIYLRANYRWRANQRTDTPVQMIFEITPKRVSLPTIVKDEADGSDVTIDNNDRKKKVTYASNTLQTLTLELGSLAIAFDVDDSQNTSGLFEVSLNDAPTQIRYTAQYAGTYALALILKSSNNYAWPNGYGLSSEDAVFYYIEIQQLAVSLPEVVYVDADKVSNVHDDYENIRKSLGTPVSLDTSLGVYGDISKIYDTALIYVYLFGDVVDNGEVSIKIEPQDNPNNKDYGGSNVSVKGEVKGHYLYAKYVDTYIITISFNLNPLFNRPNCHWKQVPGATNILSRQIKLTINKRGLVLPEIKVDAGETAPAWVGDTLTKTLVYDGAPTGPSIEVENCLSSLESSPFMTYTYDESLTKYTRSSGNVLTFSIIKTANVGTTYYLKISLDVDNEYWINPLYTPAPGDPAADIADKTIYIKIEKLGVKKPVLIDEKEPEATYLPDGLSKAFTYNGKSWLNALKVSGIDTEKMTSNFDRQTTTFVEYNDGAYYALSTIPNPTNAGMYSVALTLKDTVNLKWDGTTDDSSDLVFNLIIEPKKVAMVEVVWSDCDLDPSATLTASGIDSIVTTTYWKGHEQTIVVKNFIDGDDAGQMNVVNSSNDKFASSGRTSAGWLTYSATTVGEYVLTFSLSGNLAWDDGAGGSVTSDILITLKINKKEYAAPEIYDDPTLVGAVNGDTKTVTYNFAKQEIRIDNYNVDIMSYYGTTADAVTGETLENLENKYGATTYTFQAIGAGTYKIMFALRDYKNECWTNINADRIEFIFKIEKLKVAIPVVDAQEFLLNGESVSPASTFKTTYDTLRHSALVLNVLDTSYMTFRMGGNYNDETKDTFVISDTAIAASYEMSGGNKICKTVAEIFGTTKRDGYFKTAGISTTSLVDRDNFILMQATEPGTYNVVFTLANSNNICWSDNSVTDKTVTLLLEKVKLTSPQYKTGASNQVAYTGAPIKFYVAKANNGQPDAWTTPAFYYETASYRCVSDSTKEISLVSWYGSELVVEATQIGKYEVTVRISDPKHVVWTDNPSATYETFTFTIKKSDIIPTVEYVDALNRITGTTDSATVARLSGGASNWSKSVIVTARITVSNIKLAVGTASPELDVDGFALEIYYVNIGQPNVKLNHKSYVAPPRDVVSTLLPSLTPGGGAVYSKTDLMWSVELTSSGVYCLHYDYEILPDPSNWYDPDPTVPDDETLIMGSYRLHVMQNGESTNYSIGNTQKTFTIEADPAPFTTANAAQYIVWEVYRTSKPETVYRTYALSDFSSLTSWTAMQKSMAIELPYLDDDSYVVKVNFSAPGLQGPDPSEPPATAFTEALLRWQVKWSGVYGGTPNAKYASKLTASSAPYEVTITLQALDSKLFSFPNTTYKFYYHITPILYDLKDVTWDYTGAFTYDGTIKTVKLQNLPTGLSVASYDVSGFDRNVQIYAKSQAEHSAKYKTSVTFTSSNRNYLVPVRSNPASYKDTRTTGSFAWEIEWEIKKQKLEVEWDNSKSEDGTLSVYVPILTTDGEKVDYTYYIDNGDPDHNKWRQVTSFEHSGNTDFKVVATLKSNPSDPALDYANNYYLEFPKEANPTDNFKIFTLGPSTALNVVLSVGNIRKDGTPDKSSFSQLQAGVTPTAGVNTFAYNGLQFAVYLSNSSAPADATVSLTGAPSTINIWDNLIITYYSTVNEFRAIPAPTEPGHYLIKLQLTKLPDDGNSYELAKTQFYFDIEKGTIDPDSYYWRYTHTDATGKQYVGQYDFTLKQWFIHHTSDSVYDANTDTYSDPAGLAVPEIGQVILEFVYDNKTHTVELYSKLTDILVAVTRNKSAVNAGKYTSTVSFSYNGKLWNEPDIPTSLDWVIEKATISFVNVSWTNTSGFVYTVSGGVEKTYSVTVSGIDPIVISYITYTTVNAKGEKVDNILSNAGTYTTTMKIEGFEEENTNYKLGDDWPSVVPNPLTWTIEQRILKVPEANGTWTEFDGKQHDLLTTVNLDNDWEEYYTLSIQYKSHTASSYAAYDGTKEFGNKYFASHAGDYSFTFAIISAYNKNNVNIVWEVDNGLSYDYVTTNRTGILMPVDKAMMSVDGWNSDGEASTVNLSGTYASNEFVDYKFYYNQSTAPTITLGASVGLVDVLSITSDTEFVIEVYVKAKYVNDIDLSAGLGGLQFAFLKLAPSAVLDDQIIVRKSPYIWGYEMDGITIKFEDEDWMEMYLADETTFSHITKDAVAAGKIDWNLYLGLTEEKIGAEDFDWAKYIGMNEDTLKDTTFDWSKHMAKYFPGVDPADIDDDMKAEIFEKLKAEKFEEINIQASIYKSLLRVNVTYTGSPITFIISEWADGYTYSNHLRIWQGNLHQSTAGDYSVTLLFVTDMNNPRCWSAEDTDNDGIADKIDRSALILNFRVSYRMIYTYEKEILKNFPTYTGGLIDILQYVLGKEFDEYEYDSWITEYGKYFTIEGSTGTNVGGYTLKLKIKEEFLETIRWYTGDNPDGQPGTYTIKWQIKPIYVADPDSMLSGTTITYDGNDHSIFEMMTGYNGGDDGSMSQDIKELIQRVIITGDRGVNADTYTARFTLPSTNFAWKNSFDGSPSANTDPTRVMEWTISPMKLDMSDICWNYDEANPFQFTLENGVPQDWELLLSGIPKELDAFLSYETNGDLGSSRSLIGTYFTVVYFFRGDIKSSQNYELVESTQVTNFRQAYPDPEGYGYVAISWKIVPRQFTPPVEKKEVNFSGVIRDVMEDIELYGFEKGWENYFDVAIEYKPYGAGDDEYVSYNDMAIGDKAVGYSMFNVLYNGTYRIKISIKSSVNASADCVVWLDSGNFDTLSRTVYLTIKPTQIRITGWTEVKENGTTVKAVIKSADFDKLSDESKALFEYITIEKATGKVIGQDLDEAYVRNNGIYFTVDFSLIDLSSYAAIAGFEIIWDVGVDHPYEFINENFGSQPVIWVPLPQLSGPTSKEFDGTEKVYTLIYTESYVLDDALKDKLLNVYGVDVSGHDFLIEAVGPDANKVNLSVKTLTSTDTEGNVTETKVYTGNIKLFSAGEYFMTLRLLPNVNLSWYDPDLYEVDSNGNLKQKGSTPLPSLDRNAKDLDFKITKASVPSISQEMLNSFEAMIPDFDFENRWYYLRDEVPDLFDFLDRTYGSLIKITGDKGFDKGDYKLIIELTDPDSSCWNLNIKETIVVNDSSWSGYDSDYEVRYVKEGGKWVVKYVKVDPKGTLVDENDVHYSDYEGGDYEGGDYKLEIAYMTNKTSSYVKADGLLDENGKPFDDIKYYLVDENGEIIRYRRDEGEDEGTYKYVEDPDGEYIVKYNVKPDGSGEIIEMPVTDSLGRTVVDVKNTVVKITRDKTSTDPYIVNWKINSSTLEAPKLNGNTLTYNGSEQSVEALLDGFNATYMEIVEGGFKTDAGTYTAKIRIIGDNYMWRKNNDRDDVVFEEDGAVVCIEWTIEKATVTAEQLEAVSWRFTDGTTDYKDGAGMVYTIVKGKAVIYWVELVNLPQALRGNILYTTNGISGAYAGRNAGLYLTSFRILGLDKNFEPFDIPDELLTVTWTIERRVLDIPSLSSVKYVFDDETHPLFDDLVLPENWEEYLTIKVYYASNTAYVEYEGYNGDIFTAYGAGRYMFAISIKEGINIDVNNPSVVWKTSAGGEELPGTGDGGASETPGTGDGEEGETPDTGNGEESETPETEAPEAVAFILAEEVAVLAVEIPEAVEAEEEVQAEQVRTSAEVPAVRVTVAQQICDRVKELTYGAQIHLTATRKYFR